MAAPATQKKDPLNIADADGQFRRKESQFRNWISAQPGARFPPEQNRYVLYIAWSCPWAHRANIVRSLKGLEDIIQLVPLAGRLSPKGPIFQDEEADEPRVEPLYGFTHLRQLYEKADPSYTGRCTVPTLWDKKLETIVSNESAEIIRMFYNEFDALLAPEVREEKMQLLPAELKPQIDELNAWVYHGINNGVYRAGFSTTQQAYEENARDLFESLDRMERVLAEGEGPFIFGERLTEADIRLFTTIVRFDAAYNPCFQCNLKMIRHDYPYLHRWLQHIYFDQSPEQTKGAFSSTTKFSKIKKGYSIANGLKTVPLGPLPYIVALA